MFAIAGAQVLLFIVLVSLVQIVFPPLHWGVPEGIGLWLFTLVFIVFAFVNAVLIEKNLHWWIPIVVATIFCISFILYNKEFLSFYPYRSVVFLFCALLSFIFPFGIKSFIQKQVHT